MVCGAPPSDSDSRDDGDNGDQGGGDDKNGTLPPVQQPSPRYKTGSNGADRINVVSDPAGAAAKLPPLFA